MRSRSSSNAALIELQKVLGRDQVDALNAAKDAAIGLSDEYGVSARDILASTANFKQAGFDIKMSMTLAKNALDLVIAGDLEAAQASEILVAALKGFQRTGIRSGAPDRYFKRSIE